MTLLQLMSEERRKVSFTLLGDLPSINRSYAVGRGRFYKQSHNRSYQDLLHLTAKHQIERPLEGSNIVVCLRFFFKRRGRDIDNPIKPILDALQGVLYANDNQIMAVIAIKGHDALNPRLEVSAWVEPEF